MAATGDSDATRLAELRARIDAIDEAMHRLLIERGTVIDALIAAKGTSRVGAAFRPQREADMMRRLAARHRGRLPLPAVEHIWREIIATFTFLQAPFRVVVDYTADAIAIHDVARFSFGYSVDLVPAAGPREVIAAVAASGSSLGLIPLATSPAAGPWWRGLSAANGPQAMALLPFIALAGRPAGTPALVVSPLLAEPAPADIAIFAITAGREELSAEIAVLAEAGNGGRRELLVAVPSAIAAAAFGTAGIADAVPLGGVARGIAAEGVAGLLRAPLTASAGAPA